jgi:trehalose/maltose transport system substrate-binding protein
MLGQTGLKLADCRGSGMVDTGGTSAANQSAQSAPSLLRLGRRSVLKGLGSLALLAGESCRRSVQPASAITLVLGDQTWLDDQFQDRRHQEFNQFTKETGIRVELVPAPEGADETLATWRHLLESGARIPDVYAIDVIWPGVLADNLLDLKPYVPEAEVAAHFPELIANDTVAGKLVALPCLIDIGLLFYRTDLLSCYGYRSPPQSWEELEDMARRIQAGERAGGRKDFWGFVWEGASSESLTCNALEWQVSDGGGAIIENDAITVNNPRSVDAWARAARWVGAISPPGVVAYKEWDADNIWQAGRAAFMRNWSTSHFGTLVNRSAQPSLTRDKFDIASLPRGRARIAATLGGRSYGISRHSLHPREASMLVRFLCRADVQLARSRKIWGTPTIPALYSDPDLMAANPYFSTILKACRNDGVLRPSTATGKKYPEVSHAYSEAVHAVLVGRKTAASAASDLQTELMQITGLKGT